MEIRLENVSKAYPFKTALCKVSATFAAGKIHALLGENGAGKSTLAKIISGRIKMSDGKLFVDGLETYFSSPKDALKKGIAEVQQRPLLSFSLTARQNILLSCKSFSSYGSRQFNKRLLELKEKWAPKLVLDQKIKDTGGAEHFYTGLLCALMQDFSCLILDEPSSFLTPEERKSLFLHLREEAQGGKTIILITHSKTEALNYSDTITLLQKGKLVGFFSSTQQYTSQANYIPTQGTRAYSSANEKEETKSKEKKPCIRFTNASCIPARQPAVRGITLCASYGEITAVASSNEASFVTFENFITGMSKAKCGGKVEFEEKEFSAKKYSTTFLRKNRVAIVSSNKTFRASNPDLSVEQMLSIFGGNPDQLIKKAGVAITKEEKCSSLSGGMLQRLILERELSINPSLVILCNPMQGLDVSAQASLCKRIESIAKEGAAVLVIGSHDFPMTLCSKVYSLQNGRISLSFSKDGLL
ncbi:MAG: ATP-binding cassette domain-containing protein [Treponema sp.]|nr:ATP-binding cassette domain-containing protein [Treponema sp.]